jgi:metallo-beta-lactamase family protein
MQLAFLGAAGEVTGSCYLVEADAVRFLVDCGLFQGGREADAKNAAAFAFDPTALDFALVSHAHLDHCGLLPRLAAAGFGRAMHTTRATADLLPVMLRDAAFIQEREAAWQRARAGRRDGADAFAPLYTQADAERACALLEGHPYDVEFAPHPAVRVRLREAGHILGAAIIEVWVAERGRETKLVFSGDLGQPGRPLVRDPASIDEADVLLVESTYGDRNHRSMQATIDELVEVVGETFDRRRGNLVVPAFALGRTQELIVLLGELVRTGRLGPLNVFVDSPLATAATEVTLKHADLLDETARRVLRQALAGELALRVRFTEDVEDSKALNSIRSGALIIAASGMCDAGRVKHHLLHNLGRAECAVLITGFQAQGTLGRRIVDGATTVRIFDEEVPVRARVHTLGGLSAHAGQDALLRWLGGFRRPPRRVFAVHGEPAAAARFAQAVADRFGWTTGLPTRGQRFRV